MRLFYRDSTHRARLASATLIVAVTTWAGVPGAWADEAQAKDIFKAMSDYLAAQTAFSFDYDSTLEVVTTDDQKLGLASSGSAAVERPDKLHATRAGGFASVEAAFDGQTLIFFNKDANLYAEAQVPGSLDHLIDELRDTYHRPLPAADLLLSNVAEALMPLITDTKDLGSGVIGGMECDHLAFRTEEVDWEILDRPRRAALSLPLRHHHHEGYRLAPVHRRRPQLENRSRREPRPCLHPARGRQGGRSEGPSGLRRPRRHLRNQGRSVT